MIDIYQSGLLVLLALFLTSFYYWTLHPMVLLTWIVIGRTKRDKYSETVFHGSIDDLVSGIGKPIILVIPTFGKRNFVIVKVKNLDKMLQDRLISSLVDRVYIVFSEPDPSVLDELRDVLAEISIRGKVRLVVEDKRRGKAAAINLAMKKAEEEFCEKPRIVIVNDDDAFFDRSSFIMLLESFKDDDVCAACIYPRYHSNILNILYNYKRFIHRLEARLCNPATIGGELIAFRTIVELDEYTLSEDLQVGIVCTAKGYKVKLVPGTVVERYPSSLRGVASRAERTILGTYIEYKRYLELESKCCRAATKFCKYIFTAYLASLLAMPITLILIPVLIILVALNALESLGLSSLQIIATVSIMSALILTAKKIRSKIADMARFYLGLLYGSLRAIIKIIGFTHCSRSTEIIVSLWRETKL